jgi:hypothetical protein
MVSTKTSRKGPATGRIMSPPKRMSASESALVIALRKVDMKGAVQAAFAFTKDIFSQAKDIRLEEVEARSGGWSVVISFTTGEPGTLSQVMGGGAPRLYKTIAIDSETGQAQSLKVWKQ